MKTGCPRSKKRLARLWGTWIAAGLGVACAGAGPQEETVLRVDSHAFPASHFSSYLRQNTYPDPSRQGFDMAVVRSLFEAYVDEQIFLVAALGDDELAGQNKKNSVVEIPWDEARTLRTRYLTERVLRDVSPPEDALRAYYDGHAEEFVLPERAAVRTMQLADAETLHHVSRSLARGEASFAELSLSYASSPAETEVRVYERGTLPTLFEEAIFALPRGEISRPVETEQGLYLFEMVERLPARMLSFEEARSPIERILRERHASERTAHHIRLLRERYRVETFPEHLLRFAREEEPPVPSGNEPAP
jgi:hypothetical protein